MSKAILLYVLWILPLPGLLLDQNYSSFNIKNVGTIVMLLQNKKQKAKSKNSLGDQKLPLPRMSLSG